MLIEMTAENFLSIKDKITLSLEATGSKKLLSNLITADNKEKFLKSAVVYGPNASGKTNLIRAVHFMWYLVKHSHNFNIDTNLGRTPFKLDKASAEKPSELELIFVHNNTKYKYGFSCTDKKIISEYLYYWPKGREALIFSRKDSREFKFTEDKKQQELIRKQITENVLYLSRATQLGYEKTKNAYDYIANYIVINPQVGDIVSKQMYENSALKDTIINIMQKADFGGITNLIVNKERKPTTQVELKMEKGNLSVNPPKQSEQDFYDIKAIHKIKGGEEVEFNLREESEGTIHTLKMLGPMLDALANKKILFIDELEQSLHPNIVKFLIRLFNSKNNTTSAQLIFTTHNTNLLDNQLFRKDQIYICSKKPNEHTVLNSFSDYDLRETTDFEKAYLDGRVGGLPFIDES